VPNGIADVGVPHQLRARGRARGEVQEQRLVSTRRRIRGEAGRGRPQIVEGDASRLPQLLASAGVSKVAVVISGLPLLSLPADVVTGIVHGVFEALPRGAALVQFTYGPTPPVPKGLRENLKLVGARGRRIWLNVPPAVVWTFRKPA